MEFTVVKSKKQMKNERSHRDTHTYSREKTKMCSVCYHAGKTPEEYTSHYLRESADPCSAIVCPILLATKCKYCHECGHTPKYCPKLQEKKERESMTSSPAYEPETTSVCSSASSVRIVSRLSTSEEEQPTKMLASLSCFNFDIRMLEDDDIWDKCVNYDYTPEYDDVELQHPIPVFA